MHVGLNKKSYFLSCGERKNPLDPAFCPNMSVSTEPVHTLNRIGIQMVTCPLLVGEWIWCGRVHAELWSTVNMLLLRLHGFVCTWPKGE